MAQHPEYFTASGRRTVLFATIRLFSLPGSLALRLRLSANGERRRTIEMESAWDEIHKGADMQVPKIYKFIIKYITPLFLFFILGMWFWQEWIPIIFMKNVSLSNRPFILGARLGLLLIFLTLAILVKIAWRRKRVQAERIR